jgi:hypothetical protein
MKACKVASAPTVLTTWWMPKRPWPAKAWKKTAKGRKAALSYQGRAVALVRLPDVNRWQVCLGGTLQSAPGGLNTGRGTRTMGLAGGVLGFGPRCERPLLKVIEPVLPLPYAGPAGVYACSDSSDFDSPSRWGHSGAPAARNCATIGCSEHLNASGAPSATILP